MAIETPAAAGVLTTTLTNLDLAGSVACEETILGVTWTNAVLRAGGSAQGTDGSWAANGVSLMEGETNSVVVLATTVSWAPGLGGATTFSDTLIVQFPPPVRITIERQETQIVLTWTGGNPPFDLQESDALQNPWRDARKNVTPPIPLPLTGEAKFYRVLARQP